jgi:uncharacterized membrane protein
MALTPTSRQNIETIVKLEEAAEKSASPIAAAAERVGRFAGTIWFVAWQVVFAGAWIGINLHATRLRPFDPFPFVLLAGILAFETLILTSFVLIRQERMSVRAERRNHLNLQISLLAEKEVTKIIQMLEVLGERFGTVISDDEIKELGKDTVVEGIADELREKLDRQ